MTKLITIEELKANESIGWYVSKGGVVYQVMTISPRKVRYVGRLATTDGALKGGK